MLDNWENVKRITKACLIFLRSSRLSWLATFALRKLNNLLPRKDTRPRVVTYQYLPTDWKDTSHNLGGISYVYQLTIHNLGGIAYVIRRIQVTIWSLLLTGLRRWYTTSRCRYQLMYPSFPTRSLATETQSYLQVLVPPVLLSSLTAITRF